MKSAIQEKELSPEQIESLVVQYANDLEIPENLHIEYVCRACCKNPELAPDIKKRKGCENLSTAERIEKWVKGFYNSYKNRLNRCCVKKAKTVPDPALKLVLAKTQKFTEKQLEKAIDAHRVAMSAENVIGNMLEVFLFEKLCNHGWSVAWGSTISHVDLCSEDGILLQVKNRDNSENSSSKTVRDDNDILFWFRSMSKNEATNWEALHSIDGIKGSIVQELNEESFQQYIGQLMMKQSSRSKKREK